MANNTTTTKLSALSTLDLDTVNGGVKWGQVAKSAVAGGAVGATTGAGVGLAIGGPLAVPFGMGLGMAGGAAGLVAGGVGNLGYQLVRGRK